MTCLASSREPLSTPAIAPLNCGNSLQLVLGIGCFITCFAAVSTLAATLPILIESLHLNDVQVGVAVAMPILLGSLCRMPLGVLSDRIGARRVMIGLLAFAIIPTFLMPFVHSFTQLILLAPFLGVPLAVFSVGVTWISAWYPRHRQGTALGILGFGNVGNSVALFGAPILAAAFGLAWAYWGCTLLLAAWLVVIVVLARDAHRLHEPDRLIDSFSPLATSACWRLGLFYFLTFGGFLAMTGYMPSLLTSVFHLSRSDAGMRAAGFVVLATVMRPVGGYAADNFGANTILKFVFPMVAVLALFLTSHNLILFSVGALGIAAAVGLGNGAVFKLVPHYFPKNVGSATGLVGAAGAIGGFFPPLILGSIHKASGSFTFGFVFLSLFSLACLTVCLLSDEGNDIHVNSLCRT